MARASPGCWAARGDRKRRPHVPGGIDHAGARHRRSARPAGRDGPRHPGRAGAGMRATSSPSCRAWREIRRTQAALAGCGALVLPLHGDLPPARAGPRAAPGRETPRVVLATSIAETSLTVPGVRIVVDGGWRRAPRLDPATGLTRLATLRISRAAAEQRAGRAGPRGAGCRHPAVVQALHRGLAAVRPAGDPGGGTLRPGAGLRRLGHGARRPALPRSAAGRRAGRGAAPCCRSRRAGRAGPHHRDRAAHGRGSARIRGWRR